MCAKITDGISLTEVNVDKTTNYDGVRETAKYELLCKTHNPVSHYVPRSATRDQLLTDDYFS
jgi:hypothetical protein